MDIKIIFTLIASIISFFIFFPYVKAIKNKSVRPHVFTWFVWGLMTLLYFFAQISDNAGIGSFTTLIVSILTFYIMFSAYNNGGDKIIKKVDWISLSLSIVALFAWFFSKSPIASVILISLADIIGFIPTIRKSYEDPTSEASFLFFIAGIRHIFVILSLENISFITSFYNFFLIVENFGFVIMLEIRKKMLDAKLLLNNQQKPIN